MTFKNCREQSLKEEGLISEQTEELVLTDKGIITQRAAVSGGMTCGCNGGMVLDLVYKI